MVVANLNREEGNMNEASKQGKDALRIYLKVLGPDHPNTKQCRVDWG